MTADLLPHERARVIELDPCEHAHALRQAIECLGTLPMVSGVRAAALDALRVQLASVTAPPVAVFKPLKPGWFEVGTDRGAMPRKVTLQGAALAWRLLSADYSGQRLGDGSTRSANTARMQLARFACWADDVARCPELAAAVRCIRVSKCGEVSVSRRPRVVTV